MLHQPAGRLVPSAILGSTGFVHFFNSVPFVCVRVFFVVNTLKEILCWGCTKPLCSAALLCPGALGAAAGRWNTGCPMWKHCWIVVLS